MGTSKGYDAPSTPQWGDLKGKVSRLAKEGRPGLDNSKQLVGQFIRANGGSQGVARNGGMGAKSAQAVARNLGSFLSLVNRVGLDEALKQTGLEHLKGKTTSDIILSLIDYFGEDASTIDQVDARNALSQLMDELFSEAEGIDGIGQILEESAQPDNLTEMLERFFGYYVYQQFCRSFYERLASKVGNAQADAFLNDILDYIKSEITVLALDRDISQIDWNGQEGEAICVQVLEKTLDVFGG
ncbi:hypothetical protein M0651_13910 [Paenibacillus sp. MBLB2552]|uniref:Uncharacterized protein n=1 Tax=Paenibacillus mellifer TaxID=2937794 RepID=A0A9X2BPQ1_9BACL|nr:hypothetical protein [Paenibacillus mellifer]MCK8488269.1 hypothetical protein [Paenibacillus mellifer]